jgi:hypothetical protein
MGIDLRDRCPAPPWNAIDGDVLCWRTGPQGQLWPERRLGTPCSNVPRVVTYHSPDGFEWGYGGGGPADFALNILEAFQPWQESGEEPVQCYQGQCSAFAYRHHQRFKAEVVARLQLEGGLIEGARIRKWIAERAREDIARDNAARQEHEDQENDRLRRRKAENKEEG